jgi:deoxyribodipyrimidine photolyase-related protein
VTPRRWLFGDQLGKHFVDDADQAVLMVESKAVFARRTVHRAKAHLVLSAMRHRAAELGDRCEYVRADTYRAAVAGQGELTVCHPTSWAARRLVDSLEDVTVLPARGFVTSMTDFASWAQARDGKRLLLEDFYRDARRRHDVLMDGAGPAGGRWNFDAENREPPPKRPTLGVPEPWWPGEDEIDDEVRHDLDAWERAGEVSFIGMDGPRHFAATRAEALHVLRDFVANRLPSFGRHEDAMLSADEWMAHSLLSAPLNLGLLDPIEVVHRAESAYRGGAAPIAAVEGFVRQVLGWRDYVWHLYWQQGESYRRGNALTATRALPQWFATLDADGSVEANCLRRSCAGCAVRRRRGHGHQALCRRGCLHRPDERLLRFVPLRPEGARRRGRVPVHRRVLGVPRAQSRAAAGQPADRPGAARPRPARRSRCCRPPGGRAGFAPSLRAVRHAIVERCDSARPWNSAPRPRPASRCPTT